ncbi:cytochrome C oxidase subunit IV family protein [Pseudomonas sp. ABC1]|uniref:cytochrome C oxidase subunit IV family protein n=1 Tax=Pseudomonas sp. ABC1 TaxID=2748080 RepID=UPI0015C34EB1|nr:cytochrome C oxidase subunit IV family protein [Pseudomonas sp. ABC1]QLF92650.1 cytochrome C oxidase subunit IV family protein [Pseudomonas sp. ABC1]
MGILLCWAGLLLLSLCSLGLVAAPVPHWTALALVVLALGKAWLIIDGFMELRPVRGPWRALLLCWSLCMALALFLAS